MERIDTHSHAIPARWRQHCMDLGYGDTDGISMVQVSKQATEADPVHWRQPRIEPMLGKQGPSVGLTMNQISGLDR
jgi:hypothetical protein